MPFRTFIVYFVVHICYIVIILLFLQVRILLLLDEYIVYYLFDVVMKNNLHFDNDWMSGTLYVTVDFSKGSEAYTKVYLPDLL